MTHNQLRSRLARVEARRWPRARYVFCTCDYTNGEHSPACPALDAGPRDTVVYFRDSDAPPIAGARVIRLTWGDDEP